MRFTILLEFCNIISHPGNNEIIVGSSNQSNIIAFEQQSGFGHTLTTPFFPALYPRDFATQHIIQCDVDKSGTNDPCRVRVIFTDFQIALDSTLEVSGVNQQVLPTL